MAKKILIVDDEPDMLSVASFRLHKSGYEILSATDGEAALKSIDCYMPDLILLDLKLPLVSGYDICRHIKSSPKLKKIPVIIFTASVGIDLEEKMKELKADDYLVKPFNAEIMLKKVEKFIGKGDL